VPYGTEIGPDDGFGYSRVEHPEFRTFVDAEEVRYLPSTPSDWNSGVDPGDTADALNQLASNMGPLLPSSAPVLDQISWSDPDGTAGYNTWNDANPLAGYTSASDAGSVNNSGDALDTLMGTAGNEHGVLDFDTVGDKDGVLNDDVVSDDNYPADCFGPGGADGGATNDLKLMLNGSALHTVDLLTFAGGNSYNGNGSGFTSLSSDISVYFPDSTPFPARKYRTGLWKLDSTDMVKGYNVVSVDHVTAAGTQSTNVHEFLLDDEDTNTTFSDESADTLVMSGGRYMSGVQFHEGGTWKYSIKVKNAYKDTYRSGNAVTFNESSELQNLSNDTLAASGGDQDKQHVVTSDTVTFASNDRLLDGSVSVTTSCLRTVQGTQTSAGAGFSGILFDNYVSNSGDLNRYFRDEDYRLHGGSNFNNDLSSNWDESESLVGANANYNDGLQTVNDILDYPSVNWSAVSNGPGGNPDYSSAAGVRYEWELYTGSPSTSSFRVVISGSHTKIADATAFTPNSNQIKVALRWPNQTGWLDLMVAFNEGDFGDTGESARYGLDDGDPAITDGCYFASLDSDGWTGVSIGTKSTASSYGKLYLRVIAPSGWTGTITSAAVTWDAS
jgi:hypothetical protein